jgi:hypothetical protein
MHSFRILSRLSRFMALVIVMKYKGSNESLCNDSRASDLEMAIVMTRAL